MDHVANYRPPKDSDDLDDVTKALHAKGCGVKTPPHTSSDSLSEDDDVPVKAQKGEVCSCRSWPRVGAFAQSPWPRKGPLLGHTAGGCALEESHSPNVQASLCDLLRGTWVPVFRPSL